MKHPHYDLIVQWAQDTSQTVWVYHEFKKTWLALTAPPLWDVHGKYHIGPTPPKAMRTLGGLEYPTPETEVPGVGVFYFIPNICHPNGFVHLQSYMDNTDRRNTEAGLVHLTKESAEAHARAILAAIKQANQGE